MPGGWSNEAGGYYSFAAGRYAKVRDAVASGDFNGDEGTFVWADNTAANFISTGPNQFLIRAAGGVGINKNTPAAGALDVAGNILASGTIKSGSSITIDGTTFGAEKIVSTGTLTLGTWSADRFYIDFFGNVGIGTSFPGYPLEMASGAHVTSGGAWTNASDRNLKENFAAVNAQAMLETVAYLPIQTWNYKNEGDAIRHLGPVAQDFRAAFGLGGDEHSITTIDADGVALAAIQGLYEIVQEKKCEVEELRSEIEDLRELVKALVAQNGGGR